MVRLFVILILLMVNIKRYVAAEEVKYPPYPDVWGYDISKLLPPEYKDEKVYIDKTCKMPDGDIWFTFHLELVNAKRSTESPDYLIKFFKQEMKELKANSIENEQIENLCVSYSASESRITHFSDGTKVELSSDGGGKLCRHDSIRQDFLIKRNKKDEEVGKYSIINAYPKAQKSDTNGYASCELDSSIRFIYKQLDFFPSSLIGLQDDTFFIWDSYGPPMIVRIDKNLNTKFRSEVNYKTRDGRTLKQNFFIIPYSIVDDFIGEAMNEKSQSFEQSLQDKLINYFIEQQEKN